MGGCAWLASQGRGLGEASPGTSQAPRRARKRTEGGASSNVFSMFDQSQIQEFKEVGHCSRGPSGGFACRLECTGEQQGVGSALSPRGRVMSLFLVATVCLRTCRCDSCPRAVLTPFCLSLCLLCELGKALFQREKLSLSLFCSL